MESQEWMTRNLTVVKLMYFIFLKDNLFIHSYRNQKKVVNSYSELQGKDNEYFNFE